MNIKHVFMIAIKLIVTIRVRVRVVKGAMDGMLMERDWLNIMLVVIGMIEFMMDLMVMVKRQDLVVVLVVRNLVGQSLIVVVRVVHTVHVMILCHVKRSFNTLVMDRDLMVDSLMFNLMLNMMHGLIEMHSLVHQRSGLVSLSFLILVAKGFVDSVLMEVNWLNIVLVIVVMVELVMSIVIGVVQNLAVSHWLILDSLMTSDLVAKWLVACDLVMEWLEVHGLTVNSLVKNGLVMDSFVESSLVMSSFAVNWIAVDTLVAENWFVTNRHFTTNTQRLLLAVSISIMTFGIASLAIVKWFLLFSAALLPL